jgi:hypothetical protein
MGGRRSRKAGSCGSLDAAQFYQGPALGVYDIGSVHDVGRAGVLAMCIAQVVFSASLAWKPYIGNDATMLPGGRTFQR